jgi:hypothetical protein
MPCMSTPLTRGQTLGARMRQARAALKRLEASIQSGRVRVQVGANGAVAFTGWKDRDGISDVCAYRTLTAENSFALRRAVAATGRQINPQAIAAGVHSHDGGHTWGRD